MDENPKVDSFPKSKTPFNWKKLGIHVFSGLFFSCLFVLAVVLVDRWHPLFDFSDSVLSYIIYTLVAVCFAGLVFRLYFNRSFSAKCWTDTDYFSVFSMFSFSALAYFFRLGRNRCSNLDYQLVFWISIGVAALTCFLLIFRLICIFHKSKQESKPAKKVKICKKHQKSKAALPSEPTLLTLFNEPVSSETAAGGLLIKDVPASFDLLDRSGLQNRLLTYIKEYRGGSSIAIGIKGVWGSGKTSLVNSALMDSSIGRDYYIIRDFSIWNYATDQSMAEAMISAVIDKLNLGMNAQHIRRVVSAYLGLVFGGVDNTFLSKVSDAASLGRQDDDRGDVFAIANRFLENANKKVIFVIDDIDRVDQDKILFVYQCVSGILKFHNIIYLMCFDDRPVNLALSNRGCQGDFLNKTLNANIVVSMPDPAVLRQLYWQCLLHLFWSRADFQKEMNDPKSRFAVLVDDCVRCIPTLREFIAFVNAISPFVFGPSILDFFDYCELSLISVSNPELYESIYAYYPKFFTKKESFKSAEEKDQPTKLILGKNYENTPEWSIVLSLLPTLRGTKTNTNDLKGQTPLYLLQYFYLYFSYGDNYYSKTLKSLKELGSSDADQLKINDVLSPLYEKDKNRFLSVLHHYTPYIQSATYRKDVLFWVIDCYLNCFKSEDSDPRIMSLCAIIITTCFSLFKLDDGKECVNVIFNKGWLAIPVFEQARQAYNYDDPELEEEVQEVTNFAFDKEKEAIIDAVDSNIFKKDSYVKGLFIYLFKMSEEKYHQKLIDQITPDTLACFLFDFAHHNLAIEEGYAYDLSAREIAGYLPLDKIQAMLPDKEKDINKQRVHDLFRASLKAGNDLVEVLFPNQLHSSSLLND